MRTFLLFFLVSFFVITAYSQEDGVEVVNVIYSNFWNKTFSIQIKTDLQKVKIQIVYTVNGKEMNDDSKETYSKRIELDLQKCYLEFYMNNDTTAKFCSNEGQIFYNEQRHDIPGTNPRKCKYIDSIVFPLQVKKETKTECELMGKIVGNYRYQPIKSIYCPGKSDSGKEKSIGGINMLYSDLWTKPFLLPIEKDIKTILINIDYGNETTDGDKEKYSDQLGLKTDSCYLELYLKDDSTTKFYSKAGYKNFFKTDPNQLSKRTYQYIESIKFPIGVGKGKAIACEFKGKFVNKCLDKPSDFIQCPEPIQPDTTSVTQYIAPALTGVSIFATWYFLKSHKNAPQKFPDAAKLPK